MQTNRENLKNNQKEILLPILVPTNKNAIVLAPVITPTNKQSTKFIYNLNDETKWKKRNNTKNILNTIEGGVIYKADFQYHPYNMPAISPWPILMSFNTLAILTGAVAWFNHIIEGTMLLQMGLIITTLTFIVWFRDVTIEGTLLGQHTRIVVSSLSIGVILFVVTEVFFFLSIFWAYLHSALAPAIELGNVWPPIDIVALSPITIPMLNTVLLVSSGSVVTLAHHGLIKDSKNLAIFGTLITVILAGVFTGYQWYEYIESSFTITDSVYGTSFFFSTGFHGFHVIIGTIFITVGLCRIIDNQFSREHHVGYEASIVYWHFVDVVWLVLYALVYWWGIN